MQSNPRNEATNYLNTPVERTDQWTSNYWLMEVMPPTWAWAYRRLLTVGADKPKSMGGLP